MKRLLLMTGSIACAKATGLISTWVKQGDEVQVVCTPGALNFVGVATLEGLSQRSVMSATFTTDAMMDHIHVSRWADQIVLCPATANVINKLTAGIADDAVTTVWLAAYSHAQEQGKPMFVIPAMNSMMWQYPATQASLQTLSTWGVHVMPTVQGELACGEQGAGRMPEVLDILKFVEQRA